MSDGDLQAFRSSMVRAKTAAPDKRAAAVDDVLAQAKAFMAQCTAAEEDPDDDTTTKEEGAEEGAGEGAGEGGSGSPAPADEDMRRAASVLSRDSERLFSAQYTTNALMIVGVVGLLFSFAPL